MMEEHLLMEPNQAIFICYLQLLGSAFRDIIHCIYKYVSQPWFKLEEESDVYIPTSSRKIGTGLEGGLRLRLQLK